MEGRKEGKQPNNRGRITIITTATTTSSGIAAVAVILPLYMVVVVRRGTEGVRDGDGEALQEQRC